MYPYLLRHRAITRPNAVWAMDITYIPMARGFVYLTVVMDWASRRVLSSRVSVTLDSAFCIAAVEEAIAKYGCPEIFNTDQGAQFYERRLHRAAPRARHRDQHGWPRLAGATTSLVERLWRTIKYEEVYLHAYDTVSAATAGPQRFISPSTTPAGRTRASRIRPRTKPISRRSHFRKRRNPARESTYLRLKSCTEKRSHFLQP